jgi:uncharacterized protein YyaL (SSP411 family)
MSLHSHDINWRPWGAAAFAEAAAADKPILLNLTAVWCQWCHMMDETTYSEAAIVELINEKLVPIRVDADQHPHVQDRYIAGGWPTNAFLTPTGEVLWTGTFVPAEQFTEVSAGVLGAWDARREELKIEIDRRRKALEAARGRNKVIGLVRREAADDVLTATIDAYDDRNGGFGTAPKFPYVDGIELLFVHGLGENPDYLRMAEHSLDGMLSGEIWDDKRGGFFRYATAEDWTAPREEKLLSVNAAMLRIFAVGALVQNRADWRAIAERTVAWVQENLLLANGLWAGSDAPEDDVIYTTYNAQWIFALSYAGGRLGRQDWMTIAQRGLDALLETMNAPADLMYHYRKPDEPPRINFLLSDAVDTARACVAVAQTSGDLKYLDHARRITAGMQTAFWAEDGGFWERTKGADEYGVLRYREKPFESNADATRLLNDLAVATGERRYRALAEMILAMLSPQAGRYGVGGAGYALAMDDFFDPPIQIVVTGTGEAADALRESALSLPLLNRRVWSMPEGGRINQLNFAPQSEPAAYIAGSRGMSAPVTQPERLREVLATLR